MNIYYRFISTKWVGNKPPAKFHLACLWICLYEIRKHMQRQGLLNSSDILWRYTILFLKQIYWAVSAANKERR